MASPVCVKCRREMPKINTGVEVVSRKSSGEYYGVLSGDLFTCPVCSVQVISAWATVARYYFEYQSDKAFAQMIDHIPEDKKLILDR